MLNGDWLISSRAKFNVSWDSEGAVPGGNSYTARGKSSLSFIYRRNVAAGSVPLNSCLSGFLTEFRGKERDVEVRGSGRLL